MKNYLVTVTPKYAAHCGGFTAGQYTVEIMAKDRAAAIKRARFGYEDSAVNPASFRAREIKVAE